MGWENVPPNTCPADAEVFPDVELVDQDGRVLNVIVASMCDAEWLCVLYTELGMYEGATSITARRYQPPGEGEQPPSEYPPVGDLPPEPDPVAEDPEPDLEEPSPVDEPEEPAA